MNLNFWYGMSTDDADGDSIHWAWGAHLLGELVAGVTHWTGSRVQRTREHRWVSL